MNFLEYIFPHELPLQIIIFGIIAVAIVVFVKCSKLIAKANANLKMLDENNENSLCNVNYLSSSLKYSNIDSNAYFTAYVESKEKTEATEPLFEHLRAIYEAGHKSSRLEPELLVRNTIEKIFKGTDSIKTLISIFLVMGILGTLVGLAISIGSFNGDGFVINSEARNTAAELSKLFSNLKGAFAPSMWGVFATIIFVVYYTIFVQERCVNRLTEKLTTVTINKWLPELYPTDFQKGEISMAKLNDAVQNANKSIDNQVKFVDKTEEMFQNLTETNETIKELRNVSEVLRTSTEAYQNSSVKVAELKDVLADMAEKSKNDTEWFKTYVIQQINGIKEVQTSYLADSEVMRKSLSASTEKNIAATDGLQNMQNEVIAAVGNPLQQKLEDMSQRLENNLGKFSDSMLEISDAVARITNPLDKTAVQIQQIIRTAVDEIDKKNKLLAEQGGISEEKLNTLQSLMQPAREVTVDNSAIEEKLSEIAEHLKEIKAKDNNYSADDTNNLLESNKTNKMLAIGIAALLVISIVVQVVMVTKISALQEAQSTVTKVSMIGDLSKR